MDLKETLDCAAAGNPEVRHNSKAVRYPKKMGCDMVVPSRPVRRGSCKRGKEVGAAASHWAHRTGDGACIGSHWCGHSIMLEAGVAAIAAEYGAQAPKSCNMQAVGRRSRAESAGGKCGRRTKSERVARNCTTWALARQNGERKGPVRRQGLAHDAGVPRGASDAVYTMPWAIMASASFLKPAMLAPMT